MQKHLLTCTFCRRSENQVRKLVAGPGVYICDQCVDTAQRIMRLEPPAPEGSRPPLRLRATGFLAAVRRHLGWGNSSRRRGVAAECLQP